MSASCRRNGEWCGKLISRWYTYQNADGSPAYYVARIEYRNQHGERKKEFPVWCKGSWGLKDKGVQRIPYHLPELLKAEYVDIVEGEKDADNLIEIGIFATCNPGGAGKWPAEFAEYFQPVQRVAVLRDNENSGLCHQDQVARSLFGRVASLKKIEFVGLAEKGDVSDWLQGRDPVEAAEELSRLAEGCPEYVPEDTEPTPIDDTPATEAPAEQIETTAWQLISLKEVETLPVEPLVWHVQGLIPSGGIGFLSGAPKDGKSLLALDLSIHLAHANTGCEAKWFGRFRCSAGKVLYIQNS